MSTRPRGNGIATRDSIEGVDRFAEPKPGPATLSGEMSRRVCCGLLLYAMRGCDADETGTVAEASSGSEGADIDPCAGREATDEACNGQCGIAYVYELEDGEHCFAARTDRVCVEVGTTATEAFAVWRVVDGRTQFAALNHRSDCSSEIAPAWERCDGSVDDPGACACFCEEGVCPGQADSIALHACGLDEACAPTMIDQYLGYRASAAAATCVLEALRDRERSRLEVSLYNLLETEMFEVHLAGGDEAWFVTRYRDDLIQCPFDDEWSDASRCTLRDASYFEECLPTAGEAGQCLDPRTWFTDCESAEPTCD